jgi:phosphatidylglycerol:prolipoprotein diacylglycerol transferase
MYPHFLGLEFVHSYGLMMALGFLLAWTLVEKLFKRPDLGNLAVAMILCGVLGSRIAYVIEHWSAEFAANPVRILYIFQGGLMFYGGLILSSLVFFGWCFLKREHPVRLGDLLTVTVPLAHAFGRIGCFCYGCCYGKVSHSPLAVVFPVGSPQYFADGRQLPVLPTQLFEAAALLALFALLLSVYLKWRRFTAGLYFMGYAVIRFALEYLRGDPRAAVGPFSISQTISIAMFAFGLALLVYEFAFDNRRG